jgi:hypothetical protein
MEKEFIQYEQALALKELGFDEPCFGFYFKEKEEEEFKLIVRGKGGAFFGYQFDAPLYQQAFRWFREKYKIDVNIQKDSIGIYHFNIETNKYGDWREPIFNMNYEEAELECLKKLIEIVKTK